MMEKHEKKVCSVCDSSELISVLELPNLPLTGIFIQDSLESARFPNVDQVLMLCRRCGHAQLRFVLDPQIIYGSIYDHRSSQSPIAVSGNEFFLRFLETVADGRRFKKIVEVGCNDLYLLERLREKGDELYGIDPIWKGRAPQTDGNISVIGKFIEEVDFKEELGGAPDLVISVHTFEHIDGPKEPLRRLVDAADTDALFLIEVPGFDSLLSNFRFDQVFHQHAHYYSLASMERLIREVGGQYVAHTFNYDYWGGTMLVAFRKASTFHAGKNSQQRFPMKTERHIEESLLMFREQLAALMRVLATLENKSIFGYGAAQMLPTLAYHMKSDLSFLESVLDDNEHRAGLRYPNLSVAIRKPDPDFTLEGASVLVTALDSIRPILRRVSALKAQHVIVPLQMF